MSAETMSMPSPSQPEPLRAILLRKLFLLALSMIGVALVMAILLNQVHKAAYLLQVFASDLSLGLIAGFLARYLFRRHSAVLRFTSAYAVFILGLILLGFFSGWQAGLGPLKFGRTSVDWTGLGQLLLGVGTVILSLEAWQKPLVLVQPATEIMVQPAPVTVAPPAAERPHVRTGSRSRRTPSRRARRLARPKTGSAPEIVVEAPVKPRRKRSLSRKPKLQLSRVEEHRCPYCLELIEPKDPRGTVECKICHTLHHADCWAITGTCQVPHLNS
jgi:hypothetical protein